MGTGFSSLEILQETESRKDQKWDMKYFKTFLPFLS